MKNVIHETEIEEIQKPGRSLRWLITAENSNSKNTSVTLIRVPVGSKVNPAHSHPNGEEVIYIIKGKGQVLIDGEVDDVREGSIIVFPQNSIHMLRNTGKEEMKVICFFAPAADFSNYEFFEDVDFPDEV